MPTPQPSRRRRIQKGVDSHTGHRCARPGTRGRYAPRRLGRAQRWPVSRVPFWPCRGAQRMGWAWASKRPCFVN